MRKLILFLFFIFPVFMTIYFINAAFFFGDAGFTVDKTQNALIVSTVNAPVCPVESGDKIISIHGLSYSEFLGFNISGHTVESPGTMKIIRNSEIIPLAIQTVPFTIFSLVERIWIHLILMSIFLTLGSLALYRAPPSPQVTLFFLMLCSFSTSLSMTIPSSLALLAPKVYSSAFIIHSVFNWLSFGLWFHFALRFPETRDYIQNRRWVLLAIYLLPAATTIFGSFSITGLSSEYWSSVQKLRNLFLPCFIVGVFVKHALDYKKVSTQEEKNQIKFPLVAYWLTFSPYLFFHLLPNLVLNRPLIPFSIAMLGFLVLPMAYFIGVIRYRLFNIDRIISRTIAYFVIIIALLTIYSLFLLAGLKNWLFHDQILSNELFFIFVILVNILFHPLILQFDQLIRRLFFRHESISFKTMHEFSNKLSATLYFPSLVRTITNELPEALNVHSIACVTFEKERSAMFPDHLLIGRKNWPQSRLVKQFKDLSLTYLSPYQTIEDSELKRELLEIQKAGFSLILPANGPQALSALLFIGHKKSGAFFNEQDIHILASFANQAAIALENAIHHQSMLESKNQLEEMFDQKVHSEKMAAIGEMVSVLTHELKNPLSIIHSSAQYLLEGKRSQTVAREMLYYIKNEVEHINHSINSILKFASQKKPHFEKIDLSKKLDQLIEQWKQSASHKAGIGIKLEACRSLPWVYADFKQISQVLLNVIQNSEEMMNSSGLITIALKQDMDFVQIQVVDNGPGIPANNIDKIFSKFFTTKAHGLGLGLAVCKQIINAHNGTITIKNRNRGGTEARIRLPIKPLAIISSRNVQDETHEA